MRKLKRHKSQHSTVQEVGCHQQFKCNLTRNGELWNLRAAVGVADLVGEVLANLRVGRDRCGTEED